MHKSHVFALHNNHPSHVVAFISHCTFITQTHQFAIPQSSSYSISFILTLTPLRPEAAHIKCPPSLRVYARSRPPLIRWRSNPPPFPAKKRGRRCKCSHARQRRYPQKEPALNATIVVFPIPSSHSPLLFDIGERCTAPPTPVCLIFDFKLRDS